MAWFGKLCRKHNLSISILVTAHCLGGRVRKMDATCNPKCSSESHSSSLPNLDKIAVSTSSSPCMRFLVRFRALLFFGHRHFSAN